MAKGEPLLAGVIGCPIGHSKSPALHGHWLREHGLNGHYIPIHASREDFPDILRSLPKMGFRGVNVTLPHKEAALHSADAASDCAARVGAANTLTFAEDGRIMADNTDGHGFLENLRECLPGWTADGGEILAIGAGGAARGVIHALLDAGAPAVHLVNRTRERAEIIAGEFGSRVKVHDMNRISDLAAAVDTVVNASSAGMTGQPGLPFPRDALRPGMAVADLVYKPLRTRFLAEAEERGCRIAGGLGMLLHQAAASFDIWFGIKPRVDDGARRAVLGE